MTNSQLEEMEIELSLEENANMRECIRKAVCVALDHPGVTTNYCFIKALVDKYIFAPEELTPIKCPFC